MSSVKAKKKLMYITFSFIFLFGGVEYAVILPTLWLYLHNTYDPPEFMLGLVLSAYSLAAFLSAPILGRLSDKLRCTKRIFLICCLFQIIGSFLYFVGLSEWLCVASRFISGLGAASEAIAVAEVSRYTSEQERTGIISNLIATRQVALLLGPALNLFLRLADFKLGPFSVTKYSAPGAFMVIMWLLLILVVLLLYTEPNDIYAEEQIENRQAKAQVEDNESSGHTSSPKRYAYSQSFDLLASDDGTETVYPPLSSEKPLGSFNYDDWESSDEYHEVRPESKATEQQNGYSSGASGGSSIGNAISSKRKSYVSPSHSVNSNFSDFESSKAVTATYGNTIKTGNNSSSSGTQIVKLEASGEFYDAWTRSLPSDEVDLSSSVEILATAERLINRNQWSTSQKDVLAYGANSSRARAKLAGAVAADAGDNLFFYDNHFSHSGEEDGSIMDADERTSLLGTSRSMQNGSRPSQPGASDPYIERSFTALDDPISREGRLGFCCNEYIRDEIIAILCLLFCAMFSQVCVETMVLPLSLEYLDFGELENSLLYFVCGAEIIIVFIVLTRLTKCISDRVLLLFGAVTILSSNAWLLYFLPRLPKHNRTHNIPIFGVAVVLDVLSLPFLVVCSTSLYSKLTRKATQGLSQGLRRAIVSVGTIMAPLWGSSASTKPGLLIGVLVALQGLSLILCIFSFPRFKPSNTSDSRDDHVSNPSTSAPARSERIASPNREYRVEGEKGYEESEEWVGGASINSLPVDQSHQMRLPPTEEFFDSQSPRDRASSSATGFLTPYGSIARSSSFRSMLSRSSAESPQIWSNPTS
ncbi:hypothetical protein RRG08_066048 [Elysia crispata]|uniref:Major facilitator superfamily (MFS) profile domain-containing protein n=1 Tax=Elysia crispata TaxID=231223 RepID=A0AAE0Y2U0_9GAST|nr:hypothetical protein RRG08_066048 [Elysia crispata]